MANINLYWEDPTAGGTDGTLVSIETEVSPVESDYLLPEGSQVFQLALRCATGYNANSGVTVEPVGTKAAWWELTLADDQTTPIPGTYEAAGDPITIPVAVTTVNYVIFARLTIPAAEPVANNTSVDLQVTATLIAV